MRFYITEMEARNKSNHPDIKEMRHHTGEKRFYIREKASDIEEMVCYIREMTTDIEEKLFDIIAK